MPSKRTDIVDIIGKRYGRLEIIALSHLARGQRFMLTKCDCGKKTTKAWGNIKSGATRSCGCLEIESRIHHGMTGTKTYHAWENMISRTGTKNIQYKNSTSYIGISVCKRWLKFENFFADMGESPKGLTLDRINGSKGYSKKNCRWATRKEQQRNLKNNRHITINGITKLVSDWIKEKRMSPGAFYYRINKGMSEVEALTTPVKKSK